MIGRRKVPWGKVIGKGGIGYGLRLVSERQVSWFTYNDSRIKEGRKRKTKRKMRQGIMLSY
jgi:hypothetical protein